MPFAATGGLGDVLGSLPKACKKQFEQYGEDVDIRVVMPLYQAVSQERRDKMTYLTNFNVKLGWRNLYCGLFEYKQDGITFYFLDNEYYFKRAHLYGDFDDGERFAFFSSAAIQMMSVVDFYPDILHAHDWQSALSVIYLKTEYKNSPKYENIRAVFTIHNIAYQGKYGFEILGDVFGLDSRFQSIVAYDDCINLMKGAIVCADKVTTVSPTYAEEICYPTHGEGLEHILTANKYKLSGILNGIDYEYYNPIKDKTIYSQFSFRSLEKKALNKTGLQKEIGLPENAEVPLMAIISRLASHKGLDLVTEIIEGVVSRHNTQFVALGQGEQRFEDYFNYLQCKYPDKVRALLTYDRDLSKKIYAASDLFIMPSLSEPCGLAQMIASRYGAVPITRETGGLYDSIKGYYEENGKIYGNGFTFANYFSYELRDRIEAALALYDQPDKWKKLQRKIMRNDFSWDTSANKYTELYKSMFE